MCEMCEMKDRAKGMTQAAYTKLPTTFSMSFEDADLFFRSILNRFVYFVVLSGDKKQAFSLESNRIPKITKLLAGPLHFTTFILVFVILPNSIRVSSRSFALHLSIIAEFVRIGPPKNRQYIPKEIFSPSTDFGNKTETTGTTP